MNHLYQLDEFHLLILKLLRKFFNLITVLNLIEIVQVLNYLTQLIKLEFHPLYLKIDLFKSMKVMNVNNF